MNSLFSALPTPFYNGKIDYSSFQKLIEFQIQHHIEGLVFSGSTGEGHSLTKQEYIDLITFASKLIRQINKHIKIVFGVGFNITSTALEYIEICNSFDIDYILATVPFYNKPQQEGIYQHFAKISNLSNKEIILYNVPSRTSTDMSNDTIVKLANDFKNIVALKDATGKLERVADIQMKLKQKKLDDFTLLSGEDITQIGFNALGGKGVVSVVSNVAPDECKNIQSLCREFNYKEAMMYQNVLSIISQAMFCETNPVPVKYALYKFNIFKSDELRLPLISLSNEHKERLNNLVNTYLSKYII